MLGAPFDAQAEQEAAKKASDEAAAKQKAEAEAAAKRLADEEAAAKAKVCSNAAVPQHVTTHPSLHWTHTPAYSPSTLPRALLGLLSMAEQHLWVLPPLVDCKAPAHRFAGCQTCDMTSGHVHMLVSFFLYYLCMAGRHSLICVPHNLLTG